MTTAPHPIPTRADDLAASAMAEWQRFHLLPAELKRTRITTIFYLADCEARRRGTTRTDVVRGWNPKKT